MARLALTALVAGFVSVVTPSGDGGGHPGAVRGDHDRYGRPESPPRRHLRHDVLRAGRAVVRGRRRGRRRGGVARPRQRLPGPGAPRPRPRPHPAAPVRRQRSAGASTDVGRRGSLRLRADVPSPAPSAPDEPLAEHDGTRRPGSVAAARRRLGRVPRPAGVVVGARQLHLVRRRRRRRGGPHRQLPPAWRTPTSPTATSTASGTPATATPTGTA